MKITVTFEGQTCTDYVRLVAQLKWVSDIMKSIPAHKVGGKNFNHLVDVKNTLKSLECLKVKTEKQIGKCIVKNLDYGQFVLGGM